MNSRILLSVFFWSTLGLVGSASLLQPNRAVAEDTQRASTWKPAVLADGQPDVQGIWSNPEENVGGANAEHDYNLESGAEDIHNKILNRKIAHSSIVVDPPDGKIPYQPWAKAHEQDIYDHHTNPRSMADIDPQERCDPSGVPRYHYIGRVQITQVPGYVIMQNEYFHQVRLIPLDGHPHIAPQIKLWMGDSRGHWEGTTLVVDTTNNFHGAWLDLVGNFHSDDMHVVERFQWTDANTIEYRATLTDPKVYTRPWTMGFTMKRQGGDTAQNPDLGRALLNLPAGAQGTPQAGQNEIWEDSCVEGNRFPEHVLGNKNKKMSGPGETPSSARSE